ncbi:MAG: hypothetical protein U0835_00600 [Isosphaeraceae bacterium]
MSNGDGHQAPGNEAERPTIRDRINAVALKVSGINDFDAHLMHRLSPLTFLKEVINHFEKKVLPQGADEIGNLLYSNSAYLPWPGNNGPAPIPVPDPITAESLYGPAAPGADPGLYARDGEVIPPGGGPSAGDHLRLESPVIDGEWYEQRLLGSADRGGNRIEGPER